MQGVGCDMLAGEKAVEEDEKHQRNDKTEDDQSWQGRAEDRGLDVPAKIPERKQACGPQRNEVEKRTVGTRKLPSRYAFPADRVEQAASKDAALVHQRVRTPGRGNDGTTGRAQQQARGQSQEDPGYQAVAPSSVPGDELRADRAVPGRSHPEYRAVKDVDRVVREVVKRERACHVCLCLVAGAGVAP